MASAEISVVRKLPEEQEQDDDDEHRAVAQRSGDVRIATSMKSAWRKFSFSMVTPSGSAAPRRASAWSISRVRSRVLAPGCFWTQRMTAGLVS